MQYLRLVTSYYVVITEGYRCNNYLPCYTIELLQLDLYRYEQSAFQKGKSTLNHIFTLRILIALCKKLNKNVYIGFFDLSKAFDKVSRLELLKSLIKLGIGSCLLEAIKATYKVT